MNASSTYKQSTHWRLDLTGLHAKVPDMPCRLHAQTNFLTTLFFSVPSTVGWLCNLEMKYEPPAVCFVIYFLSIPTETSFARLSKQPLKQANVMYRSSASTAITTAEPAFKNLAKWAKTAISNEAVIALLDQNRSTDQNSHHRGQESLCQRCRAQHVLPLRQLQGDNQLEDWDAGG